MGGFTHDFGCEARAEGQQLGQSGVKACVGVKDIAQELLSQALLSGRFVWLQVKGRSMAPLIQDEDWIKVLPLTLARRGCIVLAWNDADDLICHRILALASDTVWLAGDSSSILEKLALEKVLGEVSCVEREGAIRGTHAALTRLIDSIEAYSHLLLFRYQGPLARSLLKAIRWILRILCRLAWSARIRIVRVRKAFF